MPRMDSRVEESCFERSDALVCEMEIANDVKKVVSSSYIRISMNIEVATDDKHRC